MEAKSQICHLPAVVPGKRVVGLSECEGLGSSAVDRVAQFEVQGPGTRSAEVHRHRALGISLPSLLDCMGFWRDSRAHPPPGPRLLLQMVPPA